MRARRASRLNIVLPLLLTVAFSGPLTAARPKPAIQRLSVPLVFEPNQGQTEAAVKFVSRNTRYTLGLRPDALDFRTATGTRALQMRLIGGNQAARLEGLELLPGRSFYYLGNDRSRWRSNVPNYSRVRYHDVYPGIDMVLYGNGDRLEYDLVVAPHADPSRLRLRFDGARKLSVDPNGDLRIEAKDGVLWQQKPKVYQENNGSRREIGGHYVISGRDVRFALDRYNPDRELVIDPVVNYSTYLGGTQNEEPEGVAVDGAGNTYTVGTTNSTNFPGPFNTTLLPRGGTDIFVIKIDPTGKNILYSVLIGGTADENGFGIAIDSAGNAYVVGDTNSINFPTKNAVQAGNNGDVDAVVFKLDPTGALSYSTYFGGGKAQPGLIYPYDSGSAIAVDSSGNAYVTGQTHCSDFRTSLSIPLFRGSGNGDAFVLQLGPNGNYVGSTLINGSDWEAGYAISIDSSGTLWVAGDTLSADMYTTPGAYQSKLKGGFNTGDIWIAKINPQGTAQSYLLALTLLGGSDDDDVNSIAIDNSGKVAISGGTLSADFPVTAGTFQQKYGGGTPNGTGDAFVAELDAALANRVFVTYFGGAGDEYGETVLFDKSGNLYLGGRTTSNNLTPASLATNPNALQSGYRGTQDGFLLELDPTGATPLYFTYIGGSAPEYLEGMGFDGSGMLYIVGVTGSGDFPTQPGALQPVLGGGNDAFLMSVNLSAPTPNFPVITDVHTASAGTDIAQNTWIEIKGINIAPPTTPAIGAYWDNAPEFLSSRMPTQTGGVRVKVNGKSAYVWFVCSAKTTTFCASDQINVLTPLDSTQGSVQVQVNNGVYNSVPFTVNMRGVVPSFLLAAPSKYVVAVHLDSSRVGPTSLYPGLSTPAKPGETIPIFGVGFGLPTTPLVDGYAFQSGVLSVLPVITIGGIPANVTANLISPGLYQFNVTIPSNAPDGDLLIACTYAGASTQAGALVTVQQ